MRKKSSKKLLFLLLFCLTLFIIFSFLKLFFSSQQSPNEVVESFYHEEQEGDFGSAWELFHPVMQERFSKNAYVTERSHIYMSHYGVSTFQYKILDEEEVQNWKMAKDQEAFQTAYRFTIELKFKSKFGTFTVLQDVYAVQHDDEWKIVWDFN